AYLSPAITQRIQWDSLHLSNKSYTDEKLAQLHSDLVYACQIDHKSAYIYILVEQQTTPDHLLPFRFLQCNVALLAEHLAQNKKEAKQRHLPSHPEPLYLHRKENTLPLFSRHLRLL
ncbi:MAG: Rpn family recombination-promoting nuclease/putative transposase, partial [Amoebophilaceae bacterium]|nr:Rpn family recombination-promoting nuclease/putative transposase [Amoebophilaceae bacterium]